MMPGKQSASAGRTWRVRSRRNDVEWSGPLVAYWEVHLDPMSDDYTPREITAAELLDRWAQRVRDGHPDGLIPIHWFVDSPGQGKFERMPFQFDPHAAADQPAEDFLTFCTWPVDAQTGDRLNWLSLPVVDKQWNSRRADKGGFIQEVTGWKPSVLQPFVFLPALVSTRG